MDVRGYTSVLINWNAPRGATQVICFVQALSHLMRSHGRQGQACGRRRRSINGVKEQPCCKQRRHNDISVGVNTSLHVMTAH